MICGLLSKLEAKLASELISKAGAAAESSASAIWLLYNVDNVTISTMRAATTANESERLSVLLLVGCWHLVIMLACVYVQATTGLRNQQVDRLGSSSNGLDCK